MTPETELDELRRRVTELEADKKSLVTGMRVLLEHGPTPEQLAAWGIGDGPARNRKGIPDRRNREERDLPLTEAEETAIRNPTGGFCAYGKARTLAVLAELDRTRARVRDLEQRLAATQCRNGHEFNTDNTVTLSNGWRVCRVCADALRRLP